MVFNEVLLIKGSINQANIECVKALTITLVMYIVV